LTRDIACHIYQCIDAADSPAGRTREMTMAATQTTTQTAAEMLARYAAETVADSNGEIDLAAAIRLMDDESPEVARATGLTREQVEAWCAEQA
jgi:hypothetical protein